MEGTVEDSTWLISCLLYLGKETIKMVALVDLVEKNRDVGADIWKSLKDKCLGYRHSF